MGTYDDPLGSILIGTWISSMLFMLIIRETITYYTSFKSDALGVKIFVALAVLVDTVSLSGDFAEVYLYTISHWGDLKFLSNQTWPFTLYLATTGVTGLLVQSFLVNRYYALTKNWLICVFLTLCIIVSYGGSLATVIILTRFNAYDQRFMIKIPVIVWLTMTSVTDVLIALVLIWQLYNMKTSFKTTEHLIQRLMRAAMQTGSTTSVIAISILVAYLANNTSNVGTALAFILGRVYILTLLYNLNIRKTSKKEGGTSTSDHDYRSHRGPAVAMEGIHVQRTAVVHMDTSGDDLALAPSSYKSQHDDKVPEMV
ncbi:hypothetical protein BDZ89DRAFT_1073546 [Hymenopellis radicata]|nr:hypothetical protein BDZ89DRAFT_1073525 [Hymenopellis radicata]KAF9018789.1 hypothetical protein BDZ89DRAFT_1073546 [Hymenopellis radicata]